MVPDIFELTPTPPVVPLPAPPAPPPPPDVGELPLPPALPLPLAPPGPRVLFGAVPPYADNEAKLEVPPLFAVVEAAPWIPIAAPPPPTTTEIDVAVIEKLDWSTTAPPPPPCGHQTEARPAPPLLPPPTINTLALITPVGTAQSQIPTVVKVRIVSPFEAVVDVGAHAAA